MLPESLTPSNEPAFTDQTGLSDALELIESCNVSPVDALPFDPERLYQREQERDEAMEELCRNLPLMASVSVGYARTSRVGIGRHYPTEETWTATALTDEAFASASAGTAADVVAMLMREYNAKVDARRLSDAALSA